MDLPSRHRNPAILPVLAMILGIGLARIGFAVADDYLAGQPTESAAADSVAIRRSVEMVSLSLKALTACPGGNGQAGDQAVAPCLAGAVDAA